jgi:hypothetical protein
VVAQRGNLVFAYIGDGQCHRFDQDRLEAAALEFVARELEAFALGQEVESWDKTRRERE